MVSYLCLLHLVFYACCSCLLRQNNLFPNRIRSKIFENVLDDPDIYTDFTKYPKLDYDEDYYSVLEVNATVNPKDLKKSYYKIVFQYHPDRKNSTNEKILSNKQMMVINGAYRVLRRPETR